MKNYEVKYITKDVSQFGNPKLTNKRVAYLVPNMFGKMKSGFTKKVSTLVAAYKEETSRQVVEQEPIAQIEVPLTQVEVAPTAEPTSSQASVAIETPVVENQTEKKFAIKATIADLELLNKSQIKTSSAPKKLLIPTKFKTSLFTNYIKNKEVAVAEEVKVEETISPAQAQQQAVLEYIALNSEMKNLIKEVEQIKAKMINLAKEHGLTRSMVESAMQN